MGRNGDKRASSALGTLVFLLWGLIVWGLQFTAVYVGHTGLCALGAPPAMSNLLVAVLTVIAILLILPVAAVPARMARLAGYRSDDADDLGNLLLIARAIAVLSVVAAIWTGGTAAFIDACALSR